MSRREYTVEEIELLVALEEAYEEQFHEHGQAFTRWDVYVIASDKRDVLQNLIDSGDVQFDKNDEISVIAVPGGEG